MLRLLNTLQNAPRSIWRALCRVSDALARAAAVAVLSLLGVSLLALALKTLAALIPDITPAFAVSLAGFMFVWSFLASVFTPSTDKEEV